MSPQIYNKRRSYPPDAVLCDRTTPFGNRFKVGVHGSRGECIDLYNIWIHRPEQGALRGLMRRVLKGKDLLCWCAPDRCHLEIIIRIANEEIE